MASSGRSSEAAMSEHGRASRRSTSGTPRASLGPSILARLGWSRSPVGRMWRSGIACGGVAPPQRSTRGMKRATIRRSKVGMSRAQDFRASRWQARRPAGRARLAR
eukprot:scaffold138008_cov31-Tisochrysis_lutea.AAC.11